jgi:hypothetical protein
MTAKRGRPQGFPKTGGRQPGTPNRSTQAIRELFEELKFNPIRELVQMARNSRIRPELKVSILSTLCSYRFPRPKPADEIVALEKVEVVTRIESEVRASDGAAETADDPQEESGDDLPE